MEGINLNPYTQQLLDVVVPVLLTALGTLLTTALWKFNAWLKTRVHSASFQCANDRLTILVADAVAEAQQTAVTAAKKDGKWDAERALEIRDAVVDVVKRHLGKRGMKELRGCMGIGDKDIEGRIRTLIEREVDERNGDA